MDTIVGADAEAPDRARHSRVLTLGDGRQLGYAEYGDPRGLPLLALHGTPGSRFMFALGDAPARARQLRIIAPDRAGYALTGFRASASLVETTHDVRALADALGLDRFAVAGISGGGPHAVAAAAAMPERVRLLALVSPCGPIADHAGEIGLTALNKLIFNQIGPSPKTSSAFFWALRNLVLWSPETAYRTLLQHVTSADADVLSRPEVKANLQATFQEGLRPGIAGAQQDLSLFCQPWSFPREEINVPALLWQGSADTVVPPDAAYHLARRLPKCRLEVVPAAGHYWGFGQFDTILEAIAAALPALTPAFTHCALHVRDLDASIEFYRRYCGLDIVKEHGEGTGRAVWLASPGAERSFVLVLLGGGPARTQGKDDMTHYGFGVPTREDIDRIAERAREEGCLHWEPRDYAPPTGYLCAVRDPTGYVIEFSYGQPLGPHAATSNQLAHPPLPWARHSLASSKEPSRSQPV